MYNIEAVSFISNDLLTFMLASFPTYNIIKTHTIAARLLESSVIAIINSNSILCTDGECHIIIWMPRLSDQIRCTNITSHVIILSAYFRRSVWTYYFTFINVLTLVKVSEGMELRIRLLTSLPKRQDTNHSIITLYSYSWLY